MQKTSRKILFFGNEKLATGIQTKTHIFRGILDSGYQIGALIISQKLDKNSNELEVVKLAKANNIPVKSFDNLTQSVEEIRSFGVSTAVLAAYGRIIPEEILDIFEIGIINIHPSMLPKHRGPTPIESAILAGDSFTGVSIMRLAAQMDAGPIFAQESIEIGATETKQRLADRLDLLGKDILIKNLENIMNGSLKPTKQPSEGATYDNLINKEDGYLTWQEPWGEIQRKLRAYNRWPGVRFNVGKSPATLLEADFNAASGLPGKYVEHNGCLACYCQNGLVIINRLIPAGSKAMTGKEYLMGYGRLIFS
jgi:methionyl-tRNA formyltransferase